MTTGAEIEREARRWLGTPWQHQGRLLGIGVDCIGVVIGVRNALGLVPDYQDTRDYGPDPDGRMGELMDRYLRRVPITARRQGDVVHIAWARLPQHAGILTASGTLIHAYGRAHGVVESTLSGLLLRGVRACYRFPEVAD